MAHVEVRVIQPDTLRFSLLGPVRAWRGSAEVDVGTPQQQAVLAMLLLRDGRPVDIDELVDGVWGEDPPKTAVGTVRTYASRLRAGLDGADATLRTVGRGYTLAVPHGAVDVAAFEQDVTTADGARAAGQVVEAAELLRTALARYEGRPLYGVPGPYADAVRDRLVERRLQVLHARLDVDLRLGRHDEVVGELTELCAEHPLREELRAQLMLALYRCARPAEALSVYLDTAKALAEQFGVDPGPELTALYQRILRLDTSLDAPVRQPTLPVPVAVRPAALPPAPADFTGRESLVAQLCDALAGDSAVVVSAVAGIGGVGKTSLAVYVAQLVPRRFPDGQLYVNLRGAQAEPAEPAAVLGNFLRALGVADSAVPDGVDERAALFRSVLSGRRVLVVLDDARDAAQVRPLLPGAPGCAVLVTSRSKLATLPASLRVDLDVLEPAEAVALLSRIVGAERAAAEQPAALELVCLCGLLPLAVRIVGARLAARSGWTIESMTRRLADQRGRLAELRADDLDVASSFRLGYDQLDPVAARAFRLLAVPDVPDIDVGTAAATLDLPERLAADVLEQLVDVAMLESTGVDRYRYHDLLRLFARRESDEADSPADRIAVLRRYLSCQLATARNAYRVVRPGHGITESLAANDCAGARVASRDDALDWAAHEHASMLAVIGQAAAHDELTTVAANLLLALDPLLEFGFLWHELVEPARAVLAQAQRADDPRATGRVGYMLGGALMQLGLLAEAETLSSAAAHAAEVAGDIPVLAEIHTVRGVIFTLRKELPRAEAEYRCASSIAESCASHWGQANALLNLATVQARSGAVTAALESCRHSLALFQPLGDPFGEGHGLCAQGRVLRQAGEYDSAIGVFLRCVAVARASRLPIFEILGVVEIAGCHLAAGRHADALAWAEQGRASAARVSWERTEAEALTLLGRALAGLGEPERSRACLRAAHTIFTRLGLPAADELRPLLADA